MADINQISTRFIEAYEYLKEKGLIGSKSAFSEAIGVSSSSLTEIFKGRSNVGIKIIQNTVNKFTDIDAEWLLTGKGRMIMFRIPTIANNVAEEDPVEYNLKRKGIPLIPVDALAGWGEGSVQLMAFDLERYYIPEFEDLGVEFMIRVRGNSMEPKYANGSLVGCVKVQSSTFFQWNRVHVLDTAQGALIKRIKKSSLENHITCVSDNKEYDPFELNLEEVNAIALVVGYIGLD